MHWVGVNVKSGGVCRQLHSNQDVVWWKARQACGSFQSGWTPLTSLVHLCGCEKGREGRERGMHGLKKGKERKKVAWWSNRTVSKYIQDSRHLLRLCAVSSGVSQTMVVYTRATTITASAVSVWASLSGGRGQLRRKSSADAYRVHPTYQKKVLVPSS